MTDAKTDYRAHAAELVRFVFVGGCGVVVDFVVYFALTTFVPVVPTPVSKSTSFIAGATLCFFLNRLFVFKHASTSATASRQALPFVALYIVTLGLNTAVNSALLAAHAPKFVAWFCATGASTVANFIGLKFFVFRKTKIEAPLLP